MATLLQGGQCLVERDGHYELIPQSVLIQDGRIAALGAEADAAQQQPDVETVAARDRLVAPGWNNLHAHNTQSVLRGLIPGSPLEVWLLAVRFAQAEMTPRDHYVAAQLSAVESLRTGTTGVMDHLITGPFPKEDAVHATFRAYADVGIRATVAPMYADVPQVDGLPWKDELIPPELGAPPREWDHDALFALLDRLRAAYHGSHGDRLRIGLGPGMPQDCSEALLRRTAEYSARFGLVIHTHLLESRTEAISARVVLERSHVDYLDETGCLTERTSLAHSVWLAGPEVDLVARRGAWLVHNPISNLRLGSGIAPLAQYLALGAKAALGSDGGLCCGSVSMLDELQLAALLGAPNTAVYTDWPSEHTVLRMATQGGAGALQFPDAGAIRVGARADLVLYDLADFPFVPRNNPVRQLVYGGARAVVDRVYVDGELVVDRGHVTRVDEAALFAEANELADRLRRDVPTSFARAEPLRRPIETICARAYAEIGQGRLNLLW